MTRRNALPAIAVLMGAGLLLIGSLNTPVRAQSNAASAYRSPNALAVSPDGKTLYATDRSKRNLTILDAAGKTQPVEIALQGRPQDVSLSADGATLYVAEHGAGSVAVIDAAARKVASRISVGKWPFSLGLANQGKRLYVGNQDNHTISVIDLSKSPFQTIKQISVIREPASIAVTPDEAHVVVVNLLPLGLGTDPRLAADVSIIDAKTLKVSANVRLPAGSTLVQGVCTSPDGKWAYAVHGLGRFNMPITQLERGWVNTFALSVIDIQKGTRLATVLLDDLTQGAADPHSVVCAKDGKRLWISHTGVHEVSTIELAKLHGLLDGKVPEDLAALKDGTRPNIWVRIQEDRANIAELENHLTALYIAGAIRRAPSGGKGPKGIALSADQQSVLVANYFSGSVASLSAADGKLQHVVSLGTQPEPNPLRRGELIFHDATRAFQRWHSCGSCHANEGRVDGLRWDFLADGIGNAKDTISLVFVEETAPLNRRATTKTARDCARGGLEGTNMLVPTDQEVVDLYAYMTSLRPLPSPHLNSDGSPSDAAVRGKQLFESKAGCVRCHPGPYFTDKKMHKVGVLSDNEPDGRYDTPSLIEAHRTAPYLHDGRALTLKDVFTTHNPKDQHGKTGSLSEKELNDLIAYLLSL